MAVKILLDTSAYIELMDGHEEVSELVRRADEVLLSPIVLGELMQGFRMGRYFEMNYRSLRVFLEGEAVSVVAVGEVTADRYSRIAMALRAKGRPIPTNDMWIAAHAMEMGADLVSADRHFEYVDGIALVPIEAN